MMKDSLIIIRAHDRLFIRLIITQDRSIRGRLTITRAHDRLTIHGPVMAAVSAAASAAASAADMAEDMAEDTDTKRH